MIKIRDNRIRKSVWKRNPVGAILILTVFILTSCTSFDSEQEGVVGVVYNVNGVKVLMDTASDNLLAYAIRNDSGQAVDLSIRALGGEIAFSTKSGSGFGGAGKGNVIRAAYLVQPGSAALMPGQEIMGKIFLRNWYNARKNFTSRFEFRVKTEYEYHMVKIEADQDDIFDNSKDMFQQNKLNRNDPSRFGARSINADRLPEGYTLNVPE